MKFVDEISIRIASGRGGSGKTSFRREAMTPRGGPDGGDGGRGGDVIVKVTTNINSLVDYRINKLYKAEDGQNGQSSNCAGRNGDDLILWVPPGTLIKSIDGEPIVDMTDIEEHVILKGGRGGKGNTFFKNSVNQAPEHSQPGEPNEELEVILELKLIADVGIIGFPNAGKSTLISRISAARPKIANYPFTTLTPNLGVVKLPEFKSFVIADIPGLIKGASQGVGLGIQFLKHVERTRVFVHLIDISVSTPESALQDYNDIKFELERYDEQNKDKEEFFPLSTREQIVVFNKIDAVHPASLEKMLKFFETQTRIKPLSISAVSGKNVDKMIFEIGKYL